VARSESSVANAREFGADAIAGTISELPAGLDGAVVAVNTSGHAGVIEKLLPLGIPVFTEKPLADCVEDARRLAESAADRIFVMDKWRYHPGVEALAAIARSGELGPVDSIRLTRHGWGISHDDVDAVWVLAPHDLSIALEILGWLPEPRWAVAELDSGGATGLTGVLGASPRVVISVSARHPRHQRSVAIYCRHGSAMLEDSDSPRILVAHARDGKAISNDAIQERAVAAEMPLLRELRAFCEHLKGGPPPRSSAVEGLHVVECLEKLRALAGFDGVAARETFQCGEG
jgi:predicted dehydrogenase